MYAAISEAQIREAAGHALDVTRNIHQSPVSAGEAPFEYTRRNFPPLWGPHVSPANSVLLRRIEDFSIDGDGTPILSFAARLAREHGWSRDYAERVIREYKRYVFLAMTVGKSVCPSEEVDAAWHLHLTYTRSYWKRFCTETLGQPLHHEPTQGGPAENDKHFAMYNATLAAYREAFGESALSDIWPSAEVRFGEDLRQRTVNTSRNWVIPKAGVRRLGFGLAAAIAAAIVIPGCDGNDPFQLKGIEFLKFLIPAILVASLLGRILRSMMRGPGPMPQDDEITLDWQQAAYLAGGEDRLASAVVTRLYSQKVIHVSADHAFIERNDRLPAEHTPTEAAVYDLLPLKNDKEGMAKLVSAVKSTYAEEAARLKSDGLALSQGRDSGIGCLALIPLLLVLVGFGVPRLLTGMQNDKPFAFLVITMVVGGFVGMAIAAGGRRRTTRRGEALLNRLRRSIDVKRLKNKDNTHQTVMAVALLGTAVLTGTALAMLTQWYPRLTSGSSGCSSGCSTSGGGDGGDGGGDGGGGGCGGCGGGGGD